MSDHSLRVNRHLSWILPAALLLLLSASFVTDAWEFEPYVSVVIPVDSSVTDTPSMRLSAAEQDRLGGDTSMYSCYSCHDPGDEPEVLVDDSGIVQYEEHTWDFVLEHGANRRNEYCYTCHNQENLEELITPQGLILSIYDANPLCGGCHGTTYRDWEGGLHGRVTGYWQAEAGPSKKEDCTSCHNAHNPAFASIPPWPAPQPLRPIAHDSTDHE